MLETQSSAGVTEPAVVEADFSDAVFANEYETLNFAQREIFHAMQSERGTHLNDRPDSPTPMFWQISFGILGMLSLLAGGVLVFFFTALGSIALVLGGTLCFVAFQGTSQTVDPTSALDDAVTDSQPYEH